MAPPSGEPEALDDVNFLAGLFFMLVAMVFYMATVGFVYFLPKSDSEGRTLRSLGQMLMLALLWLPPAISSLATSAINNWRWFLLSGLIIVGSATLNANQAKVDKGVDAYETSAYLPVVNNVFFPIANTVRMLVNSVLCFTNILANLTRIFTNQLFDIALNCAAMDWSVIPEALRDFAISSADGLGNWVRSGFTEDLKVAPMIAALADILSAFNPIFDCECNDLNFLWPIFINPSYGIIQSPHLHLIPETAINLKWEGYALWYKSGLTVGQLGIELITGGSIVGCNGSRACEVEREPKFDNIMRLQCNFYTNSADFLDDILYSIDSMLFDKLNLLVRWNSTPRPFGMMAMPLCAKTDLIFIALDTLTHLDLFWRISPYTVDGNYAAELRFETLFNRFYNFTYQLEQLGTDIGGDFAEPLFCVLGRTARILVAIVDYVAGLIQYLLAYSFVNNPLGQYSQSVRVQNIRNNITADAAQIRICAEELGEELGHGGKYLVIGIAMTVEPLIKIVDDFIENSGTGGDVLSYLGSFDFQSNMVKTFEGLNVIVASVGGTIRSTGAFGSTTCSVRDLDDDPRNLEKIEMGSMHLNIMCGIGTTVEMLLRYPLAIIDYLVGIIIAIAQIVVSIVSGPISIDDFAAPFQDGGAFDIGKDNGILETQCLLMDSISLIPPSLLTLGPMISCPSSTSTLVAQPIYDVLRSGARYVGMAPFWFARAVIQTLGKFFCGASSCLNFSTWCDAFIKPLWKGIVTPPVQIVVAIFDLVGCLTPGGGIDSALSTIGVALGKAFIDTRYGTDAFEVVVDCTDLVGYTDGGLVINFLCGFFETLATLVDLILVIFEKGFWQAIWEWISGALKAVLDFLKASLECIWGIIQFAFNKLGACLSTIIRLDRIFTDPDAYFKDIKSKCGNWNAVFSSCDLSFTIPEFGIDSPLPNPGYGTSGGTGTGIPYLESGEMSGVCILPDQTSCSSRPSFDTDYSGQSCANLAATQDGANRFIVGRTCAEALNVTFDPYDSTLGACCIPDVGCSELTYSACNNTGNVWVENENCNALSSTCRVDSSPYTTQLGCCVTPEGVNPLLTDLRVASIGFNAYDCYKSSTPTIRAYFIADDPSCSNVDPRLLNETNAVLDDPATGGALPYQRTPCTPESEIYKTLFAFQVDAACAIAYGPSSPFPSINALPIKTKIAGTGFADDNSIGTWWYCRDTTLEQRNTYPEGESFTSSSPYCSGQDTFCRNNLRDEIYNYGNQIDDLTDSLFAGKDGAFISLTSLSNSQRVAAFDNAFTTECRFAWLKGYNCLLNDCDYTVVMSNWSSSVSIGSLYARNSESTALDPANYPPSFPGVFVGSDCRIQKKTLFGIPRFDEGVAYTIPFIDALMSDLDLMSGLATDGNNRLTMTILYGANTTFDLTRDNTDARCNTFRYPDYPPPAPVTTGTTGSTTGFVTTGGTTGTTGAVMSPDYVEEAPVYIPGSDEGSSTLSSGTGSVRRLLSFSGIEAFNYEENPLNESHPCFMIYYYWKRAHNESDGLTFLLQERLDLCIISDSASYFFEALLLWDSRVEGKRLISPYILYSPIVGYSTTWNATKGAFHGFGYVGYYFQSYLKMKTSGVNNTNFAVSWNQYAAFNEVVDGLGYRIGSFIALFGQTVAAADWQNIKLPGGMGIFDFIFGMATWSELRSQNYTFPVRANNMSQYDAPTISDSGWEWFNSWFNWTSSIDDEGFTSNGNNMTLALNYNRKLSNLKTYMSSVADGSKTEMTLAAHGGGICDPTDRSCIDCELVVSTVEVLIEVVENCIEDLQNTKRFNLDPTQVDLTRNNTFILDTDALACTDPTPLEETALLTFFLDIFDLVVDSRYWAARISCYFTNFDDEDPHSTLLYGKKIFQCDPINDGSAHRGRGGIGLVPAILVVGGIYIGLILLSTCFLPVIPTNWVTFLVLYLAIILLAYWSSPACFFGSPIIPIPVIVDALPDDIYVELRKRVPVNCTEYHPDVASPVCDPAGRDFVDCSDFGFDYTGARHLAYLLYAISPGLTDSLLTTSVPVLSSLMATDYYQTAFEDIEDVFGTPIGEYCVGVSHFNVRRIAPIFAALAQLLSVGLIALSAVSLIIVLLFLAAALLEFLVNFSVFVTTTITRWGTNHKRYIGN